MGRVVVSFYLFLFSSFFFFKLFLFLYAVGGSLRILVLGFHTHTPTHNQLRSLMNIVSCEKKKKYNWLTSGCSVVLYQSSGNGRDYLTDVGKAQFGWGIELRDTRYGFVLPPEQILPSGIEIWEGLKYAWSQF